MNEKDRERALRFGAYIKSLRQAQGKSQQEVATKCGYTSRAAISSLEKGKNDLAFDKLPLLAQALGVDPVDLFSVYADDEAETAETQPQIEAIKGMLYDLSPVQLQQVAAIVKVMRDQDKGGAV